MLVSAPSNWVGLIGCEAELVLYLQLKRPSYTHEGKGSSNQHRNDWEKTDRGISSLGCGPEAWPMPRDVPFSSAGHPGCCGWMLAGAAGVVVIILA